MKVLLLGYSDIARRRVLPALRALGVRTIDIASISHDVTDGDASSRSKRFRTYDRALVESSADLVYISTVNSRHAELAEKALNRGFHVIIDKPACLGLEATRRVVQAARDRQRCVAEATVYMYHPRFQRVLREFQDMGSLPTRIAASFSFPPRAPENFRYKAALGGGAILDLGPYAVTPGRVFFGRSASEIVTRSVSTAGDVDTAFSFLATYPDHRSAVGSFGFTTEYINRLDIFGPRLAAAMERAFSPLPDVCTDLILRKDDKISTITFPPADTFTLFFEDVFGAIALGDFTRFTATMLSDAGEIERLHLGGLVAEVQS